MMLSERENRFLEMEEEGTTAFKDQIWEGEVHGGIKTQTLDCQS